MKFVQKWKSIENKKSLKNYECRTTAHIIKSLEDLQEEFMFCGEKKDSFLNICELIRPEGKIIRPLREIEMNSMTEETNAARKMNDLLVLVLIRESLKLY